MSLLLEKIRHIFSQDLSRRLTHFLVEDRFGSDDVKVILLCESPHTSEVCKGYPLAGDSGKDVTRVLSRWMPEHYGFNQESIPSIGELVAEQNPCVSWLGVMNVSELPFQDGAYCCRADCRSCSQWGVYISSMQYLRKKPGVKCPNDDRRRALRCAIVKDLRTRLQALATHLGERRSDILLVCCGDVAKQYYSQSEENGYRYPWPAFYAPHPSRHQWMHYLSMENLKCCIVNREPWQ